MQIELEHKIIHFEVHLMNSRREGRAHLLQEVALLIIWKLLLLLLLMLLWDRGLVGGEHRAFFKLFPWSIN